jgi:hypothetical protein
MTYLQQFQELSMKCVQDIGDKMLIQENTFKIQLDSKDKLHIQATQNLKNEWESLKNDWEKLATAYSSKQKKLKETCKEYENLVEQCLLKISIQEHRNSALKKGLTNEFEKSNDTFFVSSSEKLERQLLQHYEMHKIDVLNKALAACVVDDTTDPDNNENLKQRVENLEDILMDKIKHLKLRNSSLSLTPSLASQKIIAKTLAESAILKGKLLKKHATGKM